LCTAEDTRAQESVETAAVLDDGAALGETEIALAAVMAEPSLKSRGN
jgi:hypothetical protein